MPHTDLTSLLPSSLFSPALEAKCPCAHMHTTPCTFILIFSSEDVTCAPDQRFPTCTAACVSHQLGLLPVELLKRQHGPSWVS